MRFVHIGDSHLGLSQFNRLAEDDGMNLREKLIYEHFSGGIDRIIAKRPDVLVHAGDLFDQVKPKTVAYTTALETLERLDAAGIPLVVIAGNHDMAKTRYTTSPFRVLEYHQAEVHAAYHYEYRKVEIGDTIFHLIPNMLERAHYRQEFDRIKISRSHANVLVTHGLASTLSDRRLNTVAEHEIDASMLDPAFDYIALGHYHGQQQVADHAWYCGSQEYCSYSEIRDVKGGLIVEPDKQSVEHLDLPCTPMLDLGSLPCDGLSGAEIGEAIREHIQPVDTGGDFPMCQLTLEGVRPEASRAIDPRTFMKERSRLLDLKIVFRTDERGVPSSRARSLAGIDYAAEFDTFVRGLGLPPDRQEFVLARGQAVIRTVMEQQSEGGDAAE